MGASTWYYFTPYDSNAESALQQLRNHVFAEGKYDKQLPTQDEMKAMMEQVVARSPNSELARQQMDKTLKDLEQLRASWPVKPKAATIDELIELRAESGTHSILDIQRVSIRPDFGAVSLMPAKDLRAIFGTEKPTHEIVKQKLGAYELVEHPLVSERWQGIYFTIYRDDKPDELFFMGTSGD